MTTKYQRTQYKTTYTASDGALALDHLGPIASQLVNGLSFQTFHRVKPEEANDLPKIAYRFYGTTDLWWVIACYNGMVNVFREAPSGRLIKIPELASIDSFLRQARAVSGGVVVLN